MRIREIEIRSLYVVGLQMQSPLPQGKLQLPSMTMQQSRICAIRLSQKATSLAKARLIWIQAAYSAGAQSTLDLSEQIMSCRMLTLAMV